MKRVRIFGFEFVSETDYSELLAEFTTGVVLNDNELPFLITPNVDQIVKYSRSSNNALYKRLRRSKYVLPDGQPLVLFSRWDKWNRLRARLTGSDLFPLMWKQSIRENKKTAFILANDDIGQRLQSEYARTSFYAPPNFQPGQKERYDNVVEACVIHCLHHQPDYLFVGLGFPKQEMLALRIYDELKKRNAEIPFMFLLGASFEYYTGVKKRAPFIFRKLGVEFMHRLLAEPKRMFKRYLIDDLAFLPIAWRELFL